MSCCCESLDALALFKFGARAKCLSFLRDAVCERRLRMTAHSSRKQHILYLPSLSRLNMLRKFSEQLLCGHSKLNGYSWRQGVPMFYLTQLSRCQRQITPNNSLSYYYSCIIYMSSDTWSTRYHFQVIIH